MWPFRKQRSIFDGIPGPSPWYLRAGEPSVPGFLWSSAGESSNTSGATVLSGQSGPLLVLDFHNYVSLLGPGEFLIWHQRHVEKGPTPPVELRVIKPATLKPLNGNLEEICQAMRQRKDTLVYDGAAICHLAIPTTLAEEPQVMSFPAPLRHLDELLILCHSSGVESHPSWERSNLALMVVCPSVGTFQLHPQDWFNSAQLDYGYQWVTRVARNAVTGRVHGEGIRINPFVLDDSLRRTA